jgi:hypothetical protein
LSNIHDRIGREKQELTAEPQAELQELALIHEKPGLEEDLVMKIKEDHACDVAKENWICS